MTTFVQLKALGKTSSAKRVQRRRKSKGKSLMPSLRRMKTNQKGPNTISRNILTMPMIPSFGAGQARRILS